MTGKLLVVLSLFIGRELIMILALIGCFVVQGLPECL